METIDDLSSLMELQGSRPDIFHKVLGNVLKYILEIHYCFYPWKYHFCVNHILVCICLLPYVRFVQSSLIKHNVAIENYYCNRKLLLLDVSPSVNS